MVVPPVLFLLFRTPSESRLKWDRFMWGEGLLLEAAQPVVMDLQVLKTCKIASSSFENCLLTTPFSIPCE